MKSKWTYDDAVLVNTYSVLQWLELVDPWQSLETCCVLSEMAGSD